MSPQDDLRRRIRAGGTARGLFVPWADPYLVEVAALAGCDVYILDAEHSGLTAQDCDAALAVAHRCGLVTLVRVPGSDPKVIGQFLDQGAHGVIVPHVGSAEGARALVDACCYPPLGHRGIGPCRANDYGTAPNASYIERANRDVMILAQIEDTDGLEHAAEIVAVPRLDGVVIGPRDLSTSMGYAGDSSVAEVQEAIQRVIDLARAEAKLVSMPARTAEQARRNEERGANLNFNYLPHLLHDGAVAFMQR